MEVVYWSDVLVLSMCSGKSLASGGQVDAVFRDTLFAFADVLFIFLHRFGLARGRGAGEVGFVERVFDALGDMLHGVIK